LKVLGDELGVNETRTDLTGWKAGRGRQARFNKRDAMAPGILQFDETAAVRSGLKFRHLNSVAEQIGAHSANVFAFKADFDEPGPRVTGVAWNQFDVLARIDGEAGVLHVAQPFAPELVELSRPRILE